MKNSILLDLCVIGILAYALVFLISNNQDKTSLDTKTIYWSGDDTLKVMIVNDSAYIVKK